ncbi:unnamed protein product, partial [Coregonus sp. 'balchen']
MLTWSSSQTQKIKSISSRQFFNNVRYKMSRSVSIVTDVQMERPVEPKTREELLEYSCQLTLDPNTKSDHKCSYSDHPVRLINHPQVLCREGLSCACFYWEVEWSGQSANIALSNEESMK